MSAVHCESAAPWGALGKNTLWYLAMTLPCTRWCDHQYSQAPAPLTVQVLPSACTLIGGFMQAEDPIESSSVSTIAGLRPMPWANSVTCRLKVPVLPLSAPADGQ